MTATFGKLEHEKLQLKPGLNILHAPNEWGKSTWCAFLLAMLYGLDTKAKTTKTVLADKERYAPWSGSPMSGRIDLCWKGRDITIERQTKGRVPLGDFRAYETKTGIPVPELTAANCGQQLLGVEQSVFRRSGFVRLSDMPVTKDDALRHRLNALVTTGDESGDGERLARDLRDLRNRCRYNRSGLIPQAEAQREELEKKLAELETLQKQSAKLKQRLGEVKGWLRQLKNHQDALHFAAAEADAERVAEARDAYDRAVGQLEILEAACDKQPSREEAEKKIYTLREFQNQWDSAQMELQMLPVEPDVPEVPEPFQNKSAQGAQEMVAADIRRQEQLRRTKPYVLLLVLAVVLLVLGILAAVLQKWVYAAIGDVGGLILLLLGLRKKRSWQGEFAALTKKYGSENPEDWTKLLESHIREQERYEQARKVHHCGQDDLEARLNRLQIQRQSLCGSQSPEKVLQIWQETLHRWDALYSARREVQHAEKYLHTLQAMAKSAMPAQMADDLTYTELETARLISDAMQEQQRLQNRLGQYQGRMDALGEEAPLKKQLLQVNARLQKLEETYAALTIALETLTEARLELQRRFAPRITKRAQELMGAMSGGRYDRLNLGDDFTLHAGALQEDTLHEVLWRSDGTVDQLYLALRLAVAEELIPDAPLILDDALVRFDDERMKAALAILQKEAENKQVILFSCQKRELNAME